MKSQDNINASEILNEANRKTRELVNQSIENIRGQSEKLKENIATYANDKPYQLLGTVLVVGIVVGYLLRR